MTGMKKTEKTRKTEQLIKNGTQEINFWKYDWKTTWKI